ncbi:MAG: hypothetical protein FWB96_10160 [Defluviitaleaceae bacterium]|nr:hypothetical protein [Defluviitaleaceae bacterium]MCL2263236.1 hypothetical protein [Defluviitaleaceae bacterium]
MKNRIFFAVLLAVQLIFCFTVPLLMAEWGSFPYRIGGAMLVIQPSVMYLGAVYIFAYKADLKLFLVPLSILPVIAVNFWLLHFDYLGFGFGVLYLVVVLIGIQLPLLAITLVASIILEIRKFRLGLPCYKNEKTPLRVMLGGSAIFLLVFLFLSRL